MDKDSGVMVVGERSVNCLVSEALRIAGSEVAVAVLEDRQPAPRVDLEISPWRPLAPFSHTDMLGKLQNQVIRQRFATGRLQTAHNRSLRQVKKLSELMKSLEAEMWKVSRAALNHWRKANGMPTESERRTRAFQGRQREMAGGRI